MMLDDLNAIVLPSLPLLNLNFRVLGSLTLTTQPLTTVSFSLLAVLLITSQPSLVNVESDSLRQFKYLSTWLHWTRIFRNWSQSPLLDVPPFDSTIQAYSILLLLLGYPPTFHRISLSLSHRSLTTSFQSFTSPPPYLLPSLAHYTPHSSDGPVGLLFAAILVRVYYLVRGFTSGFRPIFRHLALP